MRMKISEIAQACGGKLLCGDPETVVTSFSTDSRQVKTGTMFVPIKGERVDSHIYLEDVLAGTAAASFTEQEILAQDKPVVLVSSTIKALQKIAEVYRKSFDIPIVGITGSVGKTTSKEMIALALSSQLKVMKTQGNQNSQVGVPMTIFTLKKADEAAVVEMGISMPGEMERIAKVVRPTIAVLSNIGVTHIEYLKTQENILAEKFHIADYIPENGKIFVNGDDVLLEKLSHERKDLNIVTFGMNKNCDCRAAELNSTEKGTFFVCQYKGKKTNVFVPAAGVHNVRNALAALAVAFELGVPLEDAVRAIGSYKPPKMRQEILDLNGIKVIDDTYNASPDSVKAGIDILLGIQTDGRRIAVLGDMFELGDYAAISHFEVGKYAQEKGIDMLAAVGEMGVETGKGFGSEQFFHFTDNQAVFSFLKKELKEGDVVLIKGSRGMKMDEIVEELKK
ncbi:UDP-N-acetylmuramoyl-tripeptide--D-alanyl-D-alanine ligase [Scatolibacter rhodanostii]|uniref:UDP-N-acetylmuramoyl-tripeptide--D-alanyl-D- alanine ligase n=1 Tax=Scatolibacter rhodanostii TaxID=2014781 RepID=UPI000C06C8BC|nr:UDP-N-acetylmuramoyl-tripeptide--D-alanyl-D-alanine ligase [Scatolibacter rhodanostii]